MPIKSFKRSDLEGFLFRGEAPGWLPSTIRKVARRKLAMVHAAHVLEDLRVPPGNRLEALKGDWKGFYSIRINRQWRVVFRWGEGAEDVDIVDYHR